MAEENLNYGPDIITLEDEDGIEHEFEYLDSVKTKDGHFVALIPSNQSPEETRQYVGELVIMQVEEEDGEEYLVTIEDDELFDKVADIFMDRLEEEYNIEQ